MIVAPVCVKLRRWGWLWIYEVMLTVFHRLGLGTEVGRVLVGSMRCGVLPYASPLSTPVTLTLTLSRC